MRIFVICNKCGFETEINQDTEYVGCMECGRLLNTCGNAKLYGIQMSERKIKELKSRERNLKVNF